MSDSFSRRQIIKAAGSFVTGVASAGSVPLVSNLIASSTLIEPVHAQARFDPVTTLLGSNKLYCYGAGSGNARWLLGGTASGNVRMSSSFSSSATSWYISNAGGPIGNWYFLGCQSNVNGNRRLLNGITANGSVNLVESSQGNSGVVWAAFTDGLHIYLNCLGNGSGDRRFLNGITANGSVDMVSSIGGGNTGTRWAICRAQFPAECGLEA